ncbi:hypothetical protein FB567DRAFT_249383 [Paraphoma chrysanthemicola]|uniref:Uncharacterized protein n=1 Tax=Paraphoma chrysanthemicola TaxID=798071 RepID=A0A8K0QS82_9PLEO|nr:hypothetical protein FB567DRAFT_249383 [Paraphoma chrysanthemicola]
MVRLFVPEGEGQHAIVRRWPDPLITNSNLVERPIESTLYATGITACLAIVGRSRPGVFLKATAYLSAAQIMASILEGYGQREVNRAVFKRENIEPKPGKLWERTKHWTVEDACVSGSVLGVFLALNPRALPGVGGWKRILGAATVGSAVGGYLGATRLTRVAPRQEAATRYANTQTRTTHYEALTQDPKAMESLSHFGRLALKYYTWPAWKVLSPSSSSQPGGVAGQAQQLALGDDPHGSLTQEDKDKYALIQVEFNKGELNGPDIEHGYRAYKDSISDRDAAGLQDWLERLQEGRQITAREAQYIWQHLARKEEQFYQLEEETLEKDIARRGIQLLNNMASEFATRDAILAFHIADTRKRLQQMKQKDLGDAKALPTAPSPDEAIPENWIDYYSPQLVADHVRINWTRQKEVLSLLEQSASMLGDLHPEPSSPQEAHFKHISEGLENMKKNVEATERLLKEFEEQVRKADAHSES